jgi:broad specificity phosphatase PhoE
MRERDAALDEAIREVAAILGDALVRLLLPEPAAGQVDFSETERPHVTAG